MGAISRMNQLYRENMQKLRSSRYNKKAGGKFSKPNSYSNYKGKLKVPELTFQEKTKLRRQIEKRNRSQKKWLMIGASLGTVIAVAVWFVQEIRAVSEVETKAADLIIQNQAQEYETYLSYGDEYLNQSQWYNAAFEYRTSLTFNPESEEALYRLTYSLMRLCETEDRECDEAQQRLEELEKTDFKPEDTNELRLRWEGINQRKP
jgi:hypothetical protein